MADGNINVGVNVRLDDAGASAGLTKLSKEAEAAMTRAGRMTTENGRRQLSETQKLALARTTLGVRSEREIQAEINRTARSYERLAASGKLSMNALARAHEATKQKITALINEQGKLTKEQEKQARGERRMAVGQKALIGLGGLAVAGRSLKDPAMRAMSFDNQLADYANIVGAGKSLEERRSLMKKMERGIVSARRSGGGTNEDVGTALGDMLASGSFEDVKDASGKVVSAGVDRALAVLPAVAKYATASGSDARDIGLVASSAMKQFGFQASEIDGVLNTAHLGSVFGAFEVKDLAKALPAQLSDAKSAGLHGREGFAALVGMNEAVRTRAGTSGEAATMVSSLLGEVSAPHFMRYMAESLYNGGKTLKRGNVNAYKDKLNDRYTAFQKQGIDRVGATAIMMDEVLQKNRQYVSLKGQLAKAEKGTAEYDNIAAAIEQQIGVVFGKVFHNKESRLAIAALIDPANKAMMGDLQKKAAEEFERKGGKEGDTAYAIKAGLPGNQAQQAAQDAATAQKAAMDALTPAIGSAAKGFSDLTKAYPGLIGVTLTAGKALVDFGMAVGGATFALRVMSGTRPSSVPGGIPPATVPTTGGVVGRGKGATVLPPAVSRGGRLLRAGTTVTVGSTAALAGSAALGTIFGENSGVSKYGSAALGGAATGATIGSLIPGIGTLIGAGTGAVGGVIWQAVQDALKDEKMELDLPVQKSEVAITVAAAPGSTARVDGVTGNGAANTTVRTDTGNVMRGAPG